MNIILNQNLYISEHSFKLLVFVSFCVLCYSIVMIYDIICESGTRRIFNNVDIYCFESFFESIDGKIYFNDKKYEELVQLYDNHIKHDPEYFRFKYWINSLTPDKRLIFIKNSLNMHNIIIK